MQYVVKAVCDRRGMNDFLRLPFEVYRNDPLWVAPVSAEVRRTLDVRRNPYFRNAGLELFVCYAGGKPAARASVTINPQHWQRSGERAAFFGFFECVEDAGAAEALLEIVSEYCRQSGCSLLEGPFNPHHYSELGMLAKGYETPPSFFQIYNPPYYHDLLVRAGLRPAKKLHTRKNARFREYIRDRYGPFGSSLTLPGFVVRHFRMDDLDDELERVRSVFNDAFAENWHFLPLTHEEYTYSAKGLHLVTRPELITIVEHGSEPVGVLECVLDINPLLRGFNGTVNPFRYVSFLHRRNKIRSAIIYAVGIKRAYQGTRVFLLLLDAARRLALEFDTLETTWISDDNRLAVKAAECLGLEPDKEFAIYSRHLAAPHGEKLLRVPDKIVTTVPDERAMLVSAIDRETRS